jgi:hypothetical protein
MIYLLGVLGRAYVVKSCLEAGKYSGGAIAGKDGLQVRLAEDQDASTRWAFSMIWMLMAMRTAPNLEW